MTVATQDSRFVYEGDGSETDFSFPRAFIAGTLRCFINRTETFGFSVVGSGLSNGVYASGTVTFNSAPADGATVTILRDPDLTAELDLAGGGVYSTLNRYAGDRTALQLQALLDRVSRAPMAPVDAPTTFDGTLGTVTGRGGYFLALKEALDGYEFIQGTDESATSATPTGADDGRTLANWFSDVVNVKADWGSGAATGNGSTDDYEAIQGAIDAAGEDGVVYFPKCASSYLIGQGHSLEPLNGQTWILDGWIRKSSASTARTDNLIKLDGVSRFTIIGRGGGLGYSTGNHLALYSTGVCDRLAFIGVKFDRLLSYFERYASNIRFLGCEFYGASTRPLGHIATGGLVNQTTGVVTIEPGLVDGLTINGCYFDGAQDEAIDINCCTVNFSITNNIFDINSSTAGNEIIDVGGACVASATIAAGGSGYSVNDVLTVSGGNFNTAATFTVTSVSGGAVTGVSLAGGGYYYRFPASLTGVATTVSPSGGTGCTLTLTVHRCGHGVIADNVFNMPAVEKRCIRLKWETFDVSVSGNVAAFASMVTTVATVSSDAISIEQCDDIRVFGNGWENFYKGVEIDGPAENIRVFANGFKNLYAGALGAGSTLTSTQDVDGLWFEENDVVMENIASGAEAIDIGYVKDFHINRNKITLPASATGDHCELRATCDDGEFIANTLVNGNYGLFANAGVTRLRANANRIEGQQREAIYFNGQNDNSQCNFNQCKDNANGASVYAITIDDMDWGQCIGNQVWDQARGIRFLTGGANNVVNDNQVDASTTAYLGIGVLTASTVRNNHPTTTSHEQAVTIASGAITVQAGAKIVTVDTESAGATDDLDTINYNGQVGDVVTFVAANSARDVVFKDGTSLKLAGDFTADNVEDTITLVFTAAATWKEMARSGNGA